MSQSFAPFDDYLIERVFQPLSDAISDRLGLHRLRAACACVELAAVAWAISQAPNLSYAVLGSQAASAVIHLALLLLGLTAMLSLRRLFRRVGTTPGNPLRHSMQPYRGVVLLLFAARLVALHGMGLAETADLAMLGLAGLALYLGACTTRPPAHRVAGLPQPA